MSNPVLIHDKKIRVEGSGEPGGVGCSIVYITNTAA